MRLSQLLRKFEGVKKSGNNSWHVLCPQHSETDGSLHLTFFPDNRTMNGNVLGTVRMNCFGQNCEFADICASAGINERDTYDVEGDTGNIVLGRKELAADYKALDDYLDKVSGDLGPAEEYAQERFGLDVLAAKALGLGFDDGGHWDRPDGFKHLGDDRGRLIIPFRDPSGKPLGVQARRVGECEASERWSMPAGSGWTKIGCFGWELDPPVIITEGPTDALAAVGAGYPALAIRGTANFKNKKVQDQIRDWLSDRPALVVGDNGESGVDAAGALAGALSLHVWYPPEGVSDLAEYLSGGGSLEDVVPQAHATQDPLEVILEEVGADLVGALRNDALLERLAALSRRDLDWLFESIQGNAPDRQQGRVDRQVGAIRAAVRELGRGGPGGPGGGAFDEEGNPLPDWAGLADNGGRPAIVVDGDTQFRDLRRQAIEALVESNEDEPKIFNRAAGELAQFVPGGRHNEPALLMMDKDKMRILLGEVADWYRIADGRRVAITPPDTIVGEINNSAETYFPHIDRLLNVPTLLPDGQLTEPLEYYPDFGFIYAPDKGLSGLEVPGEVTAEQVTDAVEFLLDQIRTFPFDCPASRLHAFVFSLTPYFRDCVDGPVPGWLVEAPVARTGKGKLVNTCLGDLGTLGTSAGDKDADEMRKAITASLRAGRPVIFLDNFNGKIAGGQLAAAMTAEGKWFDRKLQESVQLELEVKALFVFSANNPEISGELAGRLVPSRMDSGVEYPEKQSFDRDLIQPERAKKDRLKIIGAKLTILKWWAQNGMTRADHLPFGSFETWASTSAGILESIVDAFEAAGHEEAELFKELSGSFLENRAALRERSDFDHSQRLAMVDAWVRSYSDKDIKASDIVDLLFKNKDILIDIEGEGTPSSQKRNNNAGKLLRDMTGNIYNGYMIQHRKYRNWNLYRAVPIKR